jgi:hypothetical protein
MGTGIDGVVGAEADPRRGGGEVVESNEELNRDLIRSRVPLLSREEDEKVSGTGQMR